MGEKVEDCINIGKLNMEILGEYKDKIITDEVIITSERLNNHILLEHKKEYEQLQPYLEQIILYHDFILDDNKHENTILQ